MQKMLYVFGDSWPYGAELGIRCHTDAFPALIANQLGITVINESVPATSVDHAVMKFLNFYTSVQQAQYADGRQYHVLMCLTGFSRAMTYRDHTWMELHPQRSDQSSQNYYKWIQSAEQDQLNIIKNLLLVHSLCDHMNMGCFFVSNWDKVPDHPLLTSLPIYHKTLTDILGLPRGLAQPWFKRSEFVTPNISHPNIAGHALIASELSNWLAEFNITA